MMKKWTFGLMMLMMGVFIGCSDDDDGSTASRQQSTDEKELSLNKQQALQLKKIVDRYVPDIKIAAEEEAKRGKGTPVPPQRGFSFTDPTDSRGLNFSEPTSYNVYTTKDDGVYLLVWPHAMGNVISEATIGSNSYQFNYSFCLVLGQSDEEVDGYFDDLFETGFDGISVIVSVSAPTSRSGSFDEDEMGAMAASVVYQANASGNFRMLNIFDAFADQDFDEDDFDENPGVIFNSRALVYVIDSKDEHYYFSASGNVNVNRGSMSFNGDFVDFWELFGFGMIDDDDFDDDDFDDGPADLGSFPTYAGSGTLNCN